MPLADRKLDSGAAILAVLSQALQPPSASHPSSYTAVKAVSGNSNILSINLLVLNQISFPLYNLCLLFPETNMK